MVGFKSIWILFILLLFAACVPQTKQTECASDEAFNASLRTCVPVVPGPNSFINIDSPVPTIPLTKYKNDVVPVNFSVVIKNPYAQAYTVEWDRNYMGSVIPIAPTTPTTWYMSPSSLATQLGTHTITVRVKDNNGNVVDTHNFEIKIIDLPRPIINTSSITPAPYAVTFTPIDLDQTFQFTINNNNAIISGAGYRTEWALFKSGALQTNFPINTDDTFTNMGPTQNNNADYVFHTSTWGIGNYLLRARVTNNAAEVVAEQQWNITVQHPALPKIFSRNIYSSGTGPSYSAHVIAYNGVPYSPSTGDNFMPPGYGAQGDFCVEVTNGDGTYPSDGQFVRVDYYLDGTIFIDSVVTAAMDSKVCLSDSTNLSAVVFNNASPTSTQTHTLVARVVDQATNQEYTTADMSPSLGTYPVTWNFTVKPANHAPTVAFTADGNLSGITCGAASGLNRSCAVTQDAPFVVGVHVTDDFYDTSSTSDTEQAHISYSMTLYRNGSPISTCVKNFSDVADTNTPGSDFVGPDYLCQFTVPSFDAGGSINPGLDTYSVAITVSDDGSVVAPGMGMTSSTYNYILTVAEASTAPVLVPQGTLIASTSYLANASTPTSALGNAASASFIQEGSTLNFNVRVQDAERDDHLINIYLCTDFTSTCATTSLISSQNVTKADGALDTLTTSSYLIPEDLIPVTTPLGTLVDVFFKVEVSDMPDTLPGQTDTEIFSTNVTNKNPAPVVNTASRNPASLGPHDVAVGLPFTIDPGAVSDASLVASENNLTYQWYVNTAATGTFTAIGGATSRILRWTPSADYGATAYLKLCVSDGTVIYPLSGDFATICTGTRASSTFQMNIITNQVIPAMTGVTSAVPSTAAVWHDTTDTNVIYAAYTDGTSILVDKIIRNTTTGAFDTTFATVSFSALDTGTPGTPEDLSITGTADHLFVSYKCALSSDPAHPNLCVRRIEKGYGAEGSKANLSHPGKFGFSYTGIPIIVTEPAASYTAPVGSANYQITFSSVPAGGTSDSITINGVEFTADGSSGGSGNGVIDANEFCGATVSGCTVASAATGLRDLINNSTDTRLQGVSATAVLGGMGSYTVVIYGVKANDFFTSTQVALDVGKIFINGGRWHVPIIDSSLGGANQNKVTVISNLTTAHLGSVASTSTPITGVDQAISFASDVDRNGNLVLALISANPTRPGQGRLYSQALSGTTYSGTLTSLSTSLFGAETISDIRLSASKGSNTFNFVSAYGLTSSKWKIGRHDDTSLALSNVTEQDMADLAENSSSGAADVVADTGVQDIQLVSDPYINGDARIFVTNFGGSLVSNGMYLLRFKNTTSIACAEDSSNGTCFPINTFTTNINSRVFSSDIQQGQVIGDSGATVNENTTDLMHILMFDNAGVPTYSYINSVPEDINGDDSSNPDGTSGWRPPYIR